MAAGGRKPKPRGLKVMTGNPGRRPLPEDESKGEWAQWLIMASVWALLIAVGLGGWPPSLEESTTQKLAVFALVMLTGAFVYAVSIGKWPAFAVVAVVV